MRAETTFVKVAAQWLAAAFLAVTLGLFFLFATAFQVSSEGTAQHILRRGVAITTDIDALLPQLENGLRTAPPSAEGDTVRVPNFPVSVDIPASDAAGLEGEELRRRILDQSAARIYDDGMSVWSEGDPESDQDIERVSTAGGLHRGFALVTQKWNTIFLVATVLFGFLSLVLAAVTWINLTSYMRLLAIGASTATAGVISLAAAVAVRFALRTAETEADPFEQQLIDLGVDVVWLFIRNYLILSLLGFAVLSVASFFIWWQSRAAVTAPARPIDSAA